MKLVKSSFLKSVVAGLFLFLAPVLSMAAENNFGGITFIGEREGVCVEIEGACAEETISFELATCDENQVEKEKFKDRMPFTLLVPVGKHKMVITKDGKKLLVDDIEISEEKVLEYSLPKKE